VASKVNTYQQSVVLATKPKSRTEQAINETIKYIQSRGNLQDTRHVVDARAKLRRIARETNIFDPLVVKEFIKNLKRRDGKSASNGTRNNHEYLYSNFCSANQLPYDRTFWKYQSPIPLIPTTEQVHMIINSTSEHFFTPFSIMAETAVEPKELHRTTRKMIDLENGVISIIGGKGHANGTYKLSEKLAENLRLYLAKYQDEHPFPPARSLGNQWRYFRNKVAKNTNRKDLKNIQMKNLRNYAGAIFYITKGKDPIQTMFFMRHKKLETTMAYLRGLKAFTIKTKYVTKTVKLGTPTTIDEITQLSNQGFEKFNEADGYQFFRTLQY
jgi:integrase